MQIKSIFPTPVGIINNFLTEEECDQYIRFGINHPSLHDNGRSGDLFHTNNLIDPIYDYDRQPFLDLRKRIASCCEDYGEEVYGSRFEWYVFMMWFNVTRKGAFQYKHNHVNSMITGVLYLKYDKNIHPPTFFSKDSPQGSTFIGYYDVEQKETYYNSVTTSFKDELSDGTLSIFPSNLWHGYETVETDDPRITIAFDALPKTLISDFKSIEFKDSYE